MDSDSSHSEDEEDENVSLSSFVHRVFAMHRRHHRLGIGMDSSSEDEEEEESENDQDDDSSGCNDSSCPHCGPRRRRRRGLRFPPPLLQMLKQGEWNDALTRLRSHREEVFWRSMDTKETPLRMAFSNVAGDRLYSQHVPMDVVVGILDAYGTSVTGANRLDAYEGSILCAIIDDWRRWNLETDNGDERPSDKEQILRLDVIRRLVCASSGIASKALYALFHLLDRINDDHFTFIDNIGCVADDGPEALEGLTKTFFSLINMVLYPAAYKKPWPSRNVDFHLPLHSMLKLGKTHSLLYESMSDLLNITIELVKTEEIYKRDEEGNTPLIIAILAKPTCTTNDMTRSIRCLSSAPGVCKITDKQGRLPLHLAIENGVRWDDGIYDIFSDEPLAISTRDVKTRFYPFQHAAVGPNADLDTVYSLLLQNPLLAKGLADKPYWEEMKDLRSKNEMLVQQKSVYLEMVKRTSEVQTKLYKTLQTQSDEIELKNIEIEKLRKKLDELMNVRDVHKGAKRMKCQNF